MEPVKIMKRKASKRGLMEKRFEPTVQSSGTFIGRISSVELG
jgi:hypothetical protein